MAFKTFTSGAVLTAADVNTYLMQQAVIVCTAATRPSSPVEGMTIHETDTDLRYAYNGSAWVPLGGVAAWQTYTPTLDQNGTVTKTTTYAAYTQNGKTVTVTVFLTVTGTGSAGTQIKVTLPVTASSSVGNSVVGSCVIDDTGTAVYIGAAALESTTVVRFIGTAGGTIGSNPSFALASGDLVRFSIVYEAA